MVVDFDNLWIIFCKRIVFFLDREDNFVKFMLRILENYVYCIIICVYIIMDLYMYFI